MNADTRVRVEAFRRALELAAYERSAEPVPFVWRGFLKDFPDGCCELASQTLAEYLTEECSLTPSSTDSGRYKVNDETQGIRPREFPDDALKVKWITGWHTEYQHFTDNLPEHLRERVILCDNPDNIDVFSEKIIQKAIMLRNMKCASEL